MILCDMHVHSRASHDGLSSVAENAMACIKNNISAFAVTDHCDIQYYTTRDVLSHIRESYEQASKVSGELGGRVKILKGIEIGEGIWSKEFTNEILKRFDFDIIISSVHAVRYEGYSDPYSTIDFSSMPRSALDEYLDMYFDEVLLMLHEVTCDIMAHLTCPLRYINGKYSLGVDCTKYKDKILKILEYIIEKSIALEINTSGIGTPYGAIMPDEWIIKAFKEMGGYIVTLGSDAHSYERIGNGFDVAIELLKKYSFKGYYYYEKRKRIFCEI